MARLSRQLDETRQSLKRELDAKQSSSVARSEEEFSRLLGEVGQLNLVRESNAHLRADNDELYKKLQVLVDALLFLCSLSLNPYSSFRWRMRSCG